jgi:23S rRNA (cytosine1962-C5)-methyltransferase
MEDAVKIWSLRKGGERRFRAGHPWVYSNELAGSPKGVDPGAPVELRDAAGRFLARGYGHPGSLIAFRALSRDPAEAEPWGAEGLGRRLRTAADLRRRLGLARVSHRLVFGEGDDLPGLIVERYVLTPPRDGQAPQGQAFVVQAQTAGAGRLEAALLAALEALVEAEAQAGPPGIPWARTAVVARNDASMRRLEGLDAEPPRILWNGAALDPARAEILLAPPLARSEPAHFAVNLLEGQKTGFYLDQGANVRLAAGLLAELLVSGHSAQDGPVRILDLFCYVGQWGAQLAEVARRAGREAHVTALDASEPALALARVNIEARGAQAEPRKADVLPALGELPAGAYDVVVADPPAFVRSRRDLPTGRAGYLRLHTGALRLVRPGGLYVACSCSHLFPEEELTAVLAKAALRNGLAVRWVARGGQGPDHPLLAQFPEGQYLKCLIGYVLPQ